jgi:hypothetical protein
MNRSLVTAILCLTLALAGVVPARAVTIDMVTVGDAGNVADTTGYGAVGYEYRIGKYEVTIGQYTEFLNAVAKSDPYGLYATEMANTPAIAGIDRTGSAGSYIYTVKNPVGVTAGQSGANRPITFVSWFDAARFANWMHNGQGTGSTETGAYTLVGGQTSGTAQAAQTPGTAVGLHACPTALRLTYAPRGEAPGSLTFPIEALCTWDGRVLVDSKGFAAELLARVSAFERNGPPPLDENEEATGTLTSEEGRRKLAAMLKGDTGASDPYADVMKFLRPVQ